MTYKLVHHTGPVVETTWWKDQDKIVPSDVWWLEGGGLSRPATDVEVELWKRIQELDGQFGSARRAALEVLAATDARLSSERVNEAQVEIETKGAAA